MGQTKGQKRLWRLVIAAAGAFAGCFAVVWINGNVLQSLPQPYKAILAIVVQWIPAIVPVVMAMIGKYKLSDLGFKNTGIPAQIITGVLIAAAMSLVLTLLPVLFGLKAYIGTGNGYTKAWMFFYEFGYCTLGVALSEELVFRGVIYRQALDIRNSKVFAVVLSSVLFGLFHIFGGNIPQIFMTALMGAFWCFCRNRIKSCSTLSLIVAHGLYDTLIVLICAIL